MLPNTLLPNQNKPRNHIIFAQFSPIHSFLTSWSTGLDSPVYKAVIVHNPDHTEGHTESASNCLYTPNYLNATPLLMTSESLASHTSLTLASCHRELLHCWRAVCMCVRMCGRVADPASADTDNCKQTSNLWKADNWLWCDPPSINTLISDTGSETMRQDLH